LDNQFDFIFAPTLPGRGFILKKRYKLQLITIAIVAVQIATFASFANYAIAEEMHLIDQMGRKVVVPKNPKRIISLAPNITEILFAIGAGDRVVGVSEFSNYPNAARSLPKVGTYIKPNLERIIELSPDIVIATADGEKEKEVKKLQSLGIGVYVINPTDFSGIIATVREIGTLVAADVKAEEVAQEMEKKIDEVKERVSGLKVVKVLLTFSMEPIITMSSGTFQDDMIRIAGGTNIAAGVKVRYPRFSVEEIIVRAPEVIVVTSMSPGDDLKKANELWSRFGTIPAVKSGRIYMINSDIVDRPAPRIIDGLYELARLLHPEAFPKKGGNNGN
jgi:cobalamin transport system substrate-binding protein